ncbi:hypothetical protein [Persicobacter sp. CCB-QB2]|uniref:hypothetical protein n=1 Tax=Persicobacter sp. CCB-QB2 TaxID=1561025 RepID=UPI0006A9A66B|nr:hypothetical protein [Persicobacter sp. CCB-QB2]
MKKTLLLWAAMGIVSPALSQNNPEKPLAYEVIVRERPSIKADHQFDDQAFEFYFKAEDPKIVMQMLDAGVNLWIDTKGGKKREVGLLCRATMLSTEEELLEQALAMAGDQKMNRKQLAGKLAEVVAESFNQNKKVTLRGFKAEDFTRTKNPNMIDAHFEAVETGMTVRFRVPKVLFAQTKKNLGVTLEIPYFKKNEGKMGDDLDQVYNREFGGKRSYTQAQMMQGRWQDPNSPGAIDMGGTGLRGGMPTGPEPQEKKNNQWYYQKLPL